MWFANGLLCKVLNLVPRHQQIVANILGDEHARLFTVLIGLSEICMGLWIISGLHKRLNVIAQIAVIATMNTMEFMLVPDLLLWGKLNSLFAFLFCCIIAIDHFYLGKKINEPKNFGIKDHPFAVEAFFSSSIVLTFAIPKEKLRSLIPECLELDTFQDKWAFLAVAMVQTKDLRPKGSPQFLGKDFFLTGYRVFVKYHTSYGKRLRGLYILKSETDKKDMSFFGNIFTHYNYTTTDISQINSEKETIIRSQNSGLDIHIENATDPVPLPKNSPFSDWKEARRFAGPLPFTFTYNQKKKEVLIIEGVREDWDPKPINILEHKIKFLDTLNFPDAILANAFAINNIPYYWKKGKIDKWVS